MTTSVAEWMRVSVNNTDVKQHQIPCTKVLNDNRLQLAKTHGS